MADSAIEVYAPIGQGRYTESQIDDIVDRMQRPTTSHSRRSRLWSRERRWYEQQELEAAVTAGKDIYRGVVLSKHYPGTWRSADQREVQEIVSRVNRPTVSYKLREASTKIYWPVWKKPQKGDFVSKSYVELPECPKTACQRGPPSPERSRSMSAYDRLTRFKRWDENRQPFEKPSERKGFVQNKSEPDDSSAEVSKREARTVPKENKSVPKDNKSVPKENKSVPKENKAPATKSVAPAKKETPKNKTTVHRVPANEPADEGPKPTRPTNNTEKKTIAADQDGNQMPKQGAPESMADEVNGQGQGEAQGHDEGQGRAQEQGQMESQGQTPAQEKENAPNAMDASPPEAEKGVENQNEAGQITTNEKKDTEITEPEPNGGQGRPESETRSITERRSSSRGSRKKSGKRKKSKGGAEEAELAE